MDNKHSSRRTACEKDSCRFFAEESGFSFFPRHTHLSWIYTAGLKALKKSKECDYLLFSTCWWILAFKMSLFYFWDRKILSQNLSFSGNPLCGVYHAIPIMFLNKPRESSQQISSRRTDKSQRYLYSYIAGQKLTANGTHFVAQKLLNCRKCLH